jgi:hypothetical protein
VDEVDAEHRAGALQVGVPEGRAVVEVQPDRQPPAEDGGAQHELAGAGVLPGDPGAVYEQAGVVVEERELASAAAALDARVRHEGPDQDLTDPDLVRPAGLEAAEGPGLGGELGAVQALALKLLAERALGDADAVTGAQDLGDVGGRALRPLPAQGGGFLEELGMAADHAGVRTHLRHPASPRARE